MNTLFVGQKIIRVSETESTNSDLKKRASEEKLPEGFTVQAYHQTSGRGQYGNAWEDEAGKNLLISVFLRPTFLHSRNSFLLSMSVCLALHDVFSSHQEGFQIKWPNDIIHNGKKYCGVLIENQLLGTRLETSIIGMGLNINQMHFENAGAASLKQLLGEPLPIPEIEMRLLEKLEQRYLDLQSTRRHPKIKEEYLSKLYGYATEILVETEGKAQEIRITDVTESGYLKALLPNQQEHSFAFKELSFIL